MTTETSPDTSPSTSPSLHRGLRILELLAAEPGGRTRDELVSDLDIDRAAADQLLATLAEHGLVRLDSEGRAILGFAVVLLARQVRPLLRDAATPILRELAEEVGALAFLTIADGGEALVVAVAEPTAGAELHVDYHVGTRHSLSRGAAGLAILAIRAGGDQHPYVFSAGELVTGAFALAAPVMGVPGLEASVGVATLIDLDAETVGPRVISAAAEVAARLS